MGKSSLLCTQKHGPRIRLGTLFTDAPLEPDALYRANHCGECRVCQDACPVGAITGRRVAIDGFLVFGIDSGKCRAHIERNERKTGRKEFCGLCLKECPVGKGGPDDR